MYQKKIYSWISILFFMSSTFGFNGITAQQNENVVGLDLERFRDSAHHWYDIKDEYRMIEPEVDQKRYGRDDIKQIADNIVLFQKDNGGWAKNYDMTAILTTEQREAVIKGKSKTNTTIDNGATHSQLSYLAEAFTSTGDTNYKDAFLKGLSYLLHAQYNNGGWPQFYPDTSGYSKFITFNDGAMIGVMRILHNIVNEDLNYLFIPEEIKEKVNSAYRLGLECIIKCQIVENGINTAWCQQHDNIDLRPQSARSFEKASICNQESSEIVRFLMSINNPDDSIVEAIESAVKWFNTSQINGIRQEWIESIEEQFLYHKTKYDRIIVQDEGAPRIWARFYELGTHVPIFCGRDGKVVYSLAEIDRDRRTGYGWYTYEPEEVYRLYEDWRTKLTPERNYLE